jgi:hypothetical protein
MIVSEIFQSGTFLISKLELSNEGVYRRTECILNFINQISITIEIYTISG